MYSTRGGAGPFLTALVPFETGRGPFYSNRSLGWVKPADDDPRAGMLMDCPDGEVGIVHREQWLQPAPSPLGGSGRGFTKPSPLLRDQRGIPRAVAAPRKAWDREIVRRTGTLKRLAPVLGKRQRTFGMRSWNKSRPSAIYYAECNNRLEIRQCSRMERPP